MLQITMRTDNIRKIIIKDCFVLPSGQACQQQLEAQERCLWLPQHASGYWQFCLSHHQTPVTKQQVNENVLNFAKRCASVHVSHDTCSTGGVSYVSCDVCHPGLLLCVSLNATVV